MAIAILTSTFPTPFCHMGKLHSGTALNIVPAAAEVAFEIRHLVVDDHDAIEQMTGNLLQS
ncbi:MAG: peptidase dimerization domain-containing protein, partial [Pseudomonadota bacterium]